MTLSGLPSAVHASESGAEKGAQGVPIRRSRLQRAKESCVRRSEPRLSGLPNSLVLWSFPAALAIVLIVLVLAGVTGSSTGFLNQFFSNDRDPALIVGHPQAIRSDEWSVQTPWTISQVEQGLPVINETFPGGSDSTVQSDLPSTDWSVAFRPHLLGFLFMPLDNAMALKWWLPAFAMMAAGYMFLVTLLPRRPVTAAVLSIGFFFAPFFQWWYLPITFWPVAWCFTVMMAVVVLLRGKRLWPRIAVSAVAGYTTVTMGMGVYVPFIIPVVFVAIAFVLGFFFTRGIQSVPLSFAKRFGRLSPLLIGGLAGVIVLVVWMMTRADTIARFLATVYPGQRFEHTGTLTKDGLVTLFGAPVTSGLGDANGLPLGANASEAATFFLTGLFLVVPLIWFLIRDRRLGRATDWTIVALLALGLLVAAFLLIPGWDGLAHLLLLDRTTTGRIRLALGLLSLLAVAIMIVRADEQVRVTGRRPPRVWALGATVLAGLTLAYLLRYLFLRDAVIVTQTWVWIVVAVLGLSAIYLFSRGWALLGAVSFLVMSLLGSASVNPVYEGVYDLNDTALVGEMKSLEQDKQGLWVGVGESFLPTAVLVQSGLSGYNGFQGAPSPEMWDQIDPTGANETAWNRLANISWVDGTGEPNPRNPWPDQIQMTFDSCSTFAQDRVEYVLADKALTQGCATLVKEVVEGPSTFYIYEVHRR